MNPPSLFIQIFLSGLGPRVSITVTTHVMHLICTASDHFMIYDFWANTNDFPLDYSFENSFNYQQVNEILLLSLYEFN